MLALSCQRQSPTGSGEANDHLMDTAQHAHTNELIHETSPYLLQHAHNPVNWYPWGEKALEKAKAENKPLLISVGYSACHWCHVMEHESFEDSTVAQLMNENFVCIKVDREERPDIDQIYMDAVQLMTQRGGWPLNCFALPDGRPFYGGTYFQKEQWMNVLDKVSKEYQGNPEKVEEFANRLTEGVQSNDLIQINPEPSAFSDATTQATLEKWGQSFDNDEGGPNRAPKFPLPNNYQFLLRYASIANDQQLLDHVTLTLDKMAYGGIYDQAGGGFARYSTDILWKVPHFEKMLYDNGQLISLYSEAYTATKNELYKDVVYETLEFIERELTADVGAFYSALDADSEGEEGKFYVWTKAELQEILGADFEVIQDYYNINNKGLWEHGNYILLRDKSKEKVAAKNDISVAELDKKVAAAKSKLMAVRDTRIRPGLDDKSLTSWNAMMLQGYADAYAAFGEEKFLEAALKNAKFITETQRRPDGGLNHNYKDGRSTINGYLEDYSFTIEALIALYEVTFDEKWLQTARELADYSIQHFSNPTNQMFYFTSDLDPALVARKTEVYDNVTPSSNSSMAKGLFLLGHYFDNADFLQRSETMLNNVEAGIPNYGSGFSNWLQLLLHHTHPFFEIAIIGDDALAKRQDMGQHFIANRMFIGSKTDSQLPLLEYKHVAGETMIYVCINKVCKLPVSEVEKAVNQMAEMK